MANSSMRILFVLPRMVSGGIERVTLNLITMFLAEGVECALALRRCHGELLVEAESLTTVHELATDGMVHFVPRLSRLLRTWQPTHVVTAFSDIALMTWLAMLVARSDARLVHGVHDTHSLEAAQHNLRGRLRHATNILAAGIVYHCADAVVTVSHGIRVEILKKYHMPPARVQTIYNPIIVESQLVMQAVHKGRVAQPVRILALGRLVRQKGFDVLIQAMAQIPTNYHWQLDIYGEGPERSALEALIAQFSLVGRVRLCGYTPYPFSVLCNADVFVLPSRREGFGNVLIEAMACGLQVVSSDCPQGPREILRDGRLGLLVRPEDPSALAAAISCVLTGGHYIDPELLQNRARDFTVAASYAHWRELLNATMMQP